MSSYAILLDSMNNFFINKTRVQNSLISTFPDQILRKINKSPSSKNIIYL